jgi:hypothetical protein
MDEFSTIVPSFWLPVQIYVENGGFLSMHHFQFRTKENINIVYEIVDREASLVSLNPAHVEVYSIQHYVIKFVSDLRQVSCFLRER